MGVILASVLIAAIIIQATFGAGVGGGVRVVPTEMPITQNTTRTFTIILQSPQSDNFVVSIIYGTCDKSWFSWLEQPRVRVEPRVQTQLYLDVRPTESGPFYFKVRAESSRGDIFESEDILIFSEPPPTPTPGPTPSPTNKPPKCIGLEPNWPSPQKLMNENGTIYIMWTACAYDPDEDKLAYKFCVHKEGLLDGKCSDWQTDRNWTWPATSFNRGLNDIYVHVRDGKHNISSRYGDCSYVYPNYQINDNGEPYYACLIPDIFPPQYVGAKIKWTACARDPEGDQDTLYYRWVVDGHRRSKWSKINTWIWDTTLGNYSAGPHDITVFVTDSWVPPLPEDSGGEASNTFEYLLEPW